MRGFPEAEISKRLNELRAVSEQAAERGFRLYFILMKIADKEKLFVTESEVENAVARLANAYEKSVHKMSQELDQQDMQGELRTQMRMDKTMAFLIENAVIEG
jgi:FKBP-type peptidyl-prolyl cis-trans isomerase (trigger factor)